MASCCRELSFQISMSANLAPRLGPSSTVPFSFYEAGDSASVFTVISPSFTLFKTQPCQVTQKNVALQRHASRIRNLRSRTKLSSSLSDLRSILSSCAAVFFFKHPAVFCAFLPERERVCSAYQCQNDNEQRTFGWSLHK